MARYKPVKSVWSRSRAARAEESLADFDVLKGRVRDGLLAMTAARREAFIQALETEMRRVHLSLRAYLIPLGIPASRSDELTPIEAAHLVRFLKISVPQAWPAIENAMARFSVFAEQKDRSNEGLAA